MVIVTGSMHFRIEDREDVIEGLEWITERSRTDWGCLDYWFAEDLAERGTFRVFERWESTDAFSSHRAAPHEEEWNQRYLAKMTGANVVQYEVLGREILVE